MASAKPVSPSQHTMSTSATPRLRSSVQDPEPELGDPRRPRPATCPDVLAAVQVDAHREVDRAVGDHVLGADLDHDRVEIHRPGRPGGF